MFMLPSVEHAVDDARADIDVFALTRGVWLLLPSDTAFGPEKGERNPTIISLWHTAKALGVRLEEPYD